MNRNNRKRKLRIMIKLTLSSFQRWKWLSKLIEIPIGIPRGRNRNVHESIVAAVTQVAWIKSGEGGRARGPRQVERGGPGIIISPGGRKEGASEAGLASTRHFGVFSLFRGSQPRGWNAATLRKYRRREIEIVPPWLSNAFVLAESLHLAFIKRAKQTRGFHSCDAIL